MPDGTPRGLYIHVPFCARKCPYCDFYSLPLRAAAPPHMHSGGAMDRYIDAVLADMPRYAHECDTLYFGGGTPSLLGADRLGRLITAAREYFGLLGAEITLEVNPTADTFRSSDADKGDLFERLAALGLNRVSVGLQSPRAEELALLGRAHTLHDAQRTVEAARRAGIRNISLDLMLDLPGQTERSVEESAGVCAGMGCTHVSAYLLGIEPGTPFAKNPTVAAPDEERGRALYLAACQTLEQRGYTQYEISNFALPGAASRHNLKYWDAREYIGLGPSAHSFLDGRRFHYPRDLPAYLDNPSPIDDGGGGGFEEYAMLRLRLSEGLTRRGAMERFGHGIPPAMLSKAKPLAAAGLVRSDENAIALTREGMVVSTSVITSLLTAI